MCELFCTVLCQKYTRQRSNFFCKVPMSNFYKTQFSLKTHCFFNYCPSKILFFAFFAIVPTMPKDIKNKNKGPKSALSNQFLKVVQNWDFLCFRRLKHNSHLAKVTFYLYRPIWQLNNCEPQKMTQPTIHILYNHTRTYVIIDSNDPH